MRKILLIRMMGLGDVASILIPAVKMMRIKHPDAEISVVTFGAGSELMELVPGVDKIFAIAHEQWPDQLFPAMERFLPIAGGLASQEYDQIINLDTWFMPCFLAQTLMDMGQPVAGNHLGYTVEALLDKLKNHELTPEYVESPTRYMKSSYPDMQDWLERWWEKYPEAGGYPQFYLNHCCGFEGEVDISLDLPADEELLARAKGRKVIALSCSGRVGSKRYPHADRLRPLLEEAGYLVWGKFDGSVPMRTTLGRLRATDLLVTVPTSTQWLAQLVGCPSLVIPGPLNPSVLAPVLSIPKSMECQYCFTDHACPKELDFACMDVVPEKIVEMMVRYFEKRGGRNPT